MSEDEKQEPIPENLSQEYTDEDNETTSTEESELPFDSDSSEQTSKNRAEQSTTTGTIISPVGDNARIIINYIDYRAILKESEQAFSSEDENDDHVRGSYGSLIKKSLRFERQYTPRFDDLTLEKQENHEKLLEDDKKLSDWYHDKLTEYEQCYVQAVAILHGAAAQEIYKRADMLYRILQEQKHNVPSSVSTHEGSQTKDAMSSTYNFTFPRQPILLLQFKTYTIARRVKGRQCLFWRDIDDYGISTFGSRVLLFLAEEFMSKGEHWENFLQTILDWTKSRGDCSWRSARALGMILWQQDIYQLCKQANDWAKAGITSISKGRLAASMLDGAREVERSAQSGQRSDTYTPVLQLLNEWTAKVHEHEKLTKVNAGLGRAVANAYALIGKKAEDREIALYGLTKVLTLKQQADTDQANEIFAAGVSAYVSLTWAGHIRKVLHSLATISEKLVRNYEPPKALVMRRHDWKYRETRLKATFDAFFLVATAAFPEENNVYPDLYNELLIESEYIAIPDTHGRDVLLVGILTGDALRASIRTILCATIVSVNINPTFELLHHWADMVIPWQASQNSTAQQLYNIFVQFLIELGRTIDIWCYDLTSRHYRKPAASEIYRHRLSQWYQEGLVRQGSIKGLANQVLMQLSADSVIYI